MKGQLTLFQNLIEEDQDTSSVEAIDRRHLRALLMAARYYHKIILLRKQYADTIEELADEFFLSERTVTNILLEDQYRAEIMAHKRDKTTVADLRKLYPYLVW